MRRKGMTLFWTQYFDKKKSVRLGRRVSQINATENPLINDIYNAAVKLGYQAEIDRQSRYPRNPYDDPGLVLIDTMGQKKTFVLRKLAPEIQKQQQVRLDQAKVESIKKKRNKKQEQLQQLRQKIQKQKGSQS